jgi:ribosomal protein L19E
MSNAPQSEAVVEKHLAAWPSDRAATSGSLQGSRTARATGATTWQMKAMKVAEALRGLSGR